jgi:hypothetical protein
MAATAITPSPAGDGPDDSPRKFLVDRSGGDGDHAEPGR